MKNEVISNKIKSVSKNLDPTLEALFESCITDLSNIYTIIDPFENYIFDIAKSEDAKNIMKNIFFYAQVDAVNKKDSYTLGALLDAERKYKRTIEFIGAHDDETILRLDRAEAKRAKRIFGDETFDEEQSK